MNFKILLIVLVAAAGVSSYGVLSNQMELDIQRFDLLVLPPMDGVPIEGATEFSEVQCACRDPNDPNGAFDPGFCNVNWIVDPRGPDGIKGTEDDVPGVPDPNSLGPSGNMLCTWEASSTAYGDLLDYDEGCSANYWLKTSDPSSPDYSWPAEFQPDYSYEDIFGIKLVGSDDNKIEQLKNKIETYKEKINNLVDEGKIKKQTGTSLIWLLDAIPLPDDGSSSSVVSSKLENFYKRIDLFVERKLLLDIDKTYILQVMDDSEDDSGVNSLTLRDALSNSILSPPDDKLAKESVAAILNAGHFQVNYHYYPSTIMQMTQDAVQGNSQIQTANELMKHNLAGGSPICPSNQD